MTQPAAPSYLRSRSNPAIRPSWFLFCLLSLIACRVDLWGRAVKTAPLLQERGTHANNLAHGPANHLRSRYLGRKFAARSGQDTSRWQRNLKSNAVARENFAVTNGKSAISPGAGFGNVGFSFRSSLPTGFIPTAVASGDFNGDGHMDVAISNGGDNSVYVLLGNGDNTFQVPEILYTQGQAPVWITAVSLRNNGHLDLAVVDADSNQVEIFFGNGDGTFQAGSTTSVPQTPTFVLSADVNKDGKPDLVVGLVVDTGATAPQFLILLGDGSGGFSGSILPPPITAPPDYPLPTGWVAAADLNNDGETDIVAVITSGFGITYLNQAGQSFSQGAPFSPVAGVQPSGLMTLALADMNEDGCLDAVELDFYGLAYIAPGTCDGNFTQTAAAAGVGDIDPAIAIADVDGDGHLDVVGSAAFYSVGGGGLGAEGGYLVSVMKGNGKGDLSMAQLYRGGTDEFSLIIADFNGDKRPEIVSVDSLENQASLFINDGSGNFDGPQGEAIGYTYGVTNAPSPVAPMEVADLNGDGKPDLFLVERGIYGNLPSQLTAILNDGAEKFLPPVRTPITVGDDVPYPIFAAGAFRDPAHADVIYITHYSSPNVVAFFAGNGDGTFAAPVVLTTQLENPLQVVTGDFNGDSRLDFAVVGTDIAATNWKFDVFLGRGDGTFTQVPEQAFPIQNDGSPQQLFALDLNHDGKLDLLIGNNDNGGWTGTGDDLIEALGNGDGTFRAPATLISHFGAVAIADVNHDGYVDLIQGRNPATDITQDVSWPPGVTVYLGTGTGTFQQQPSYNLPGFAYATESPVLVGDFNGDGIPDIGVRDFAVDFGAINEPQLALLQGTGDGTFVLTGHDYQLQGISSPFVGADFNGSGADDLVELVGYTSSFHTISAATGNVLDISLDSDPIIGSNGSATVTLDLPAVSSETVALSASDPAIQIPSTINFAVGQQSQSFNFTIGPSYDATHVFALYATLNGETASAFGSKPNPNLDIGVALSLWYKSSPLSQIAVTPGEVFQASLGLNSVGGYYGTFSSFACPGLPAGATCNFDQNSLFIPAGEGGTVNITVQTSSGSPFGLFPVQVSTSDGSISPSTTFTFGIGDFSLSESPNVVTTGPTGSSTITIKSTSTNGLTEYVALTCPGLPSGASCSAPNFSTNDSAGITVSATNLPAKDYPFEIQGKANILAHTLNAVLRVGDFTANLDGTSATLSAGRSVNFKLTLTSLNHYADSIAVACSSPTPSITCAVSPGNTNLSDGASVPVEITIARANSSSSTRDKSRPFQYAWGVALLLPALVARMSNKKRRLVALFVLFLALGMIACGGGGSAGTTSTPGGGGSAPPQIVNISVTATASVTSGDTQNQKTVGPIAITLD